MSQLIFAADKVGRNGHAQDAGGVVGNDPAWHHDARVFVPVDIHASCR
jgi:hypothetical protein